MFEGLKAGNQAVEQINKQINVDEFEELKDKLDDQMADMSERQEFFINAGQGEDQDELLDELDAMEAEMAEEEFNKVDIGSGAIMD